MKLKIAYICFVALVLTGCAGKQVDLDRDALRLEPVNKIELVDPYNEIQIERADSSGSSASLGLLGAVVGGLLDAGVNASREKSMKQLRENMLLYDIQESFNEKLALALSSTYLNQAEVINIELSTRELIDADLGVNVPRIVLSSTISGDRRTLITRATVGHRKSEEKHDVYTRNYYSLHDLGKIGIDKSMKRKTAKLASKTTELSGLIEQSLEELTELFIDDYTDNKLQSLTAAAKAAPYVSRTFTLGSLGIIKDNGDRVLMKSNSKVAPTMLYADSASIGKRKPIKK